MGTGPPGSNGVRAQRWAHTSQSLPIQRTRDFPISLDRIPTMILKHLAACATFALLPTLATAQTDDCASATTIAGEGTWTYSSLGASTDGPNPCAGIGSDVWFSWTATASDTFTLSTCSGTSYDSALAVYPAGCPASGVISCNVRTTEHGHLRRGQRIHLPVPGRWLLGQSRSRRDRGVSRRREPGW